MASTSDPQRVDFLNGAAQLRIDGIGMPHRILFFPDGPGATGLLFAWACYGIVLLATITGAVASGPFMNSISLILSLRPGWMAR